MCGKGSGTGRHWRIEEDSFLGLISDESKKILEKLCISGRFTNKVIFDNSLILCIVIMTLYAY